MKRYEIVRLLGEGGMGRVYQAIDLRTGRAVAIKTMRPSRVDATSQRLLLNEATAAARVHHPGVVELLDLQRDEDGAPYLVMELVDGEDLATWLRPWPGWTAVAPLLLQVLGALATAHAHGVVHGDLKPANVMRSRRGEAKIIDLGIARVRDVRARGQRHTAGTPLYMAPEQFTSGSVIGPWTDLYAFGVILAEILSGRDPWSGATVREVLSNKASAPIELAPREGLVVPDGLVDLVRELTRPRPRERPRFAAEVRRALERLAHGVREREVVTTPPLAMGHALTGDPTVVERAELPSEATSTSENPAVSASLTGGAQLEAPVSVDVLRARPIPLVGREDELAILGQLMLEATTSPGVRALVLLGRAGSGKSRIARQGAFWAEQEGTMESLTVAYDPARPYGTESLADALRAALGTARDHWHGAAPTEGALADHLEHWLSDRARLPLTPQSAAEIAHEVIAHVSRARPIYVWLDDVDAARDGGLELAMTLLARQEARALIVATARGSRADLDKSLAAPIAKHPRALVLEIGNLDATAKRALVRAVAPLAPKVAEELCAITDDTPLIAMHRVRDWQAQELLEDTPEGLTPRAPHTVRSLVESHPLAQVLARRIGATLSVLGPRAPLAERAAIQMALIGSSVEEGTLRAAIGHDALADDVLDVMLIDGLIVAERGGNYRFEHALVRQALIDRLEARGDAKQLCREVADALHAVHGDRLLEVNVQIASLRRLAGDATAWSQIVDAVAEYGRAGLIDAAEGIVRTAEEWLDRDQASLEDERRVDLLAAHAQVRYARLDYEGARLLVNRAEATIRALPPTPARKATLLRLRLHRAGIFFYDDRFQEAEREIRALMESGEADDDPRALTKIHHLLSNLASSRGDLETAEREAKMANVQAARLRDGWRYQLTRTALAELRLAQNDLEGALALYATVQAAGGSVNQYKGELDELTIRLDLAQGRYEQGRALLRVRVAEVERHRDPWRMTALLALEAICAAALDGIGDAKRAADRFVGAFQQIPHDEPATTWSARRLIQLLEARGARDAAERVRAALAARAARIEARMKLEPGDPMLDRA